MLLLLGLIASSAHARPLLLAAAPGLEDRDVESTLRLDDRWLAGTAHGVFSYDGLRWSSHAFADTVRWIQLYDGRVLAGASLGVWAADPAELSFHLLAASPDRNRTSLLDEKGRLLVGTDAGLFEFDGDSWRQTLSGHRVQSLAVHPENGLLVGTWGDGLLVRSTGKADEWIRNPYAGVTDALPGDYVHAIAVDADGSVRLSCSWGQLDPRYLSYKFLRQRGRSSERDPHTFSRASLARWTKLDWQVEYLRQDFSEHEVPSRMLGTLYVGRLKGSEREQWVVSIDSGREFFPCGVAAFDLETHELLWYRESANPTTKAVPLLLSGEVELICAMDAPDQGRVASHLRDDRYRLVRIDGRGRSSVLLERLDALRFLPMGEGTRRTSPASSFDILEEAIPPSETDRAVLWRIRFDPAAPDSISLSVVDSSLTESGAFVMRSKSGDWVTVGATHRAADHGTVKTLQSAKVLASASDSLLHLTQRTHLDRLHIARMTDGDWVWVGLTEDHFYLETQGILSAFDNPIPSADVSSWYLGNILGRDFPQITVERGPRGGREIWWFPQSKVLGDGEYSTSLVLDAAHFSNLELLASFDSTQVRIGSSPAALRPLRMRGGEFVGWVGIGPEGRSVRLFDTDGHVLGTTPIPKALLGASDFQWAFGPSPQDPSGLDTPVLYSRQVFPPQLYRLVGEGSGWAGPYRIDVGIEDLECNAITALAANSTLLGTDAGLRGLADDPTGRSRVRGIEDSEVSFGGFGIARLPHRHPQLAGRRVFDLVRDGDKVYAATASAIRSLDKDGSWTTLISRPAGPEIEFRLVTTRGRVVGQAAFAAAGYGQPFPLQRADPLLTRIAEPTFFESGIRRLNAIAEFRDGTAIIASNWGLHSVGPGASTTHGDPRIPLLEKAPSAALDVELVADTLCLASIEDGRVLAITSQDPQRAVPTSLTREAPRALAELVAVGDELWGRSAHGIERWQVDGSRQERLDEWDLPDSVQTRDLEISSRGGAWIATSDGLWRVNPGSGLALPVTLDGFPSGSMTRIVEAEGSLLAIVEGLLYRVDLPPHAAEARGAVQGDDLVLGAWLDGPLDGQGWAIAQDDQDEPRLVRGLARSDGATVLTHSAGTRGRHSLRAWRIGPTGERLDPPQVHSISLRDRSILANLTAILLPGLLLGIWAFDLRRRQATAFMAVLISLGIWAVLHQVLYFQLPWGSLSGVSVAVLGIGLALREREASRRVPQEAAIAQLDDLLRGFRHRGGGLNPVDELRINLINLRLLRETVADFDEILRAVLRRVLDSTEDLSVQGLPLVDYAGLEPALLRRFFHRLDELRAVSFELLEDPRRFTEWMVRPDEHLACTELCTSFARSVESMTELLARHRNVIVERFLPDYVRSLDRRTAAHVEFDNADKVERLPIKQGELSELLDNLVGNSLRACEKESQPCIRVSLRHEAEHVVIRFEDNGPGVPEELRESIFTDGFSASGSSGFGLSRCAELVEGWGGSIHCQASAELGGACFEVRIQS